MSPQADGLSNFQQVVSPLRLTELNDDAKSISGETLVEITMKTGVYFTPYMPR